MCQDLVFATLSVFFAISSKLLPTPAKSHYTFNLKDVNKVSGLVGKGREGKGREGKGREGKGREGKGREGKGREGKGRGREGEGREGGKDGTGRYGIPHSCIQRTVNSMVNLIPTK